MAVASILPATIAALGAAIGLVIAALPTRAQAEGWQIGNSAEVFRPDAPVLTTRIGGWFDASYEDNDLSGSRQSLNANHVNVFLDTRWRETWQLFVEAEFEYETGLAGFEEEREYELEQAYLRYRFDDRLEARVGSFNAPFGFWTPVHWTILMDTIRPPMHEALRVSPEQQQGLGLRGRVPVGNLFGHDAELRWSLHAGYGNGSALLEESGSDGWWGGGELRLALDTDRYAGVSYVQLRREARRDRAERAFVLYGVWHLPYRLLARVEHVRRLRRRHGALDFPEHADISYAKLRWRFHDKAYVNYRFNWGDDDFGGVSGKRYVHTWTLGIQPHPSVRLKLEVADHEIRGAARRDFRYWGISIGALF